MLRCGFWEHWVPAGNDIIRELCEEWGRRTGSEVKIDRLVSAGNQILLTIASEAQSRSGHDVIAMPTWEPSSHAQLLEPVDDVMGRLQKKYGAITPACEYLAKRDGAWRAVPAVAGTQTKPPCIRYDLFQEHAGIDIRAMWPAKPERGPGAETWNWDTFLKAAEKCNAAGYPFALPMGQYSDAVDWVGALFRSFGASMMDEEGRVTVRGNDKLKQATEYVIRLSQHLPPDVWAWDDASNNRALISGKSALVFNPPSAWAVAKRTRRRLPRNAGTRPSRRGRREGSRPSCRISGASGASRRTSWRRSRCWNSSRTGRARSGSRRRPRATTSRPSRACPTSRSGRPRGRRPASPTTTRTSRTSRGRTSPSPRRRRIRRCRPMSRRSTPR